MKINQVEELVGITKEICQKMSEEVEDFSAMDCDNYLHLMSKLEEGGARFMNVTEKDVRKKKIGSIVAASVFGLFILGMIGLLLWMNSLEGAPIGIIIFYIGALVLVLVGVITALYLRLKEIKGGEEDEAAKY